MSVQQFLKHDIPFKRDDAHRLLPAMIACLVGFAALLLAIAMTLTGSLSAQSSSLNGLLQVEIPSNKAHEALLEDVSTAIKATQGVTDISVVSRDEMETLLRPLLGKKFSFDDLPIPTVIDVKTDVVDQQSAVDVDALTKRLKEIDRNITVNERGAWVGHMAKAASLLQAIILLVAILLLACVLGMIVLVAKTNLRLHFKTVRLLHIFGATDEYILKQFQRNSAVLAGRGALIGVGIVFGAYLALVYASGAFTSPLVPALSFTLPHALMFLLLPVFTALTALLATRFTVQSMLQQMH